MQDPVRYFLKKIWNDGYKLVCICPRTKEKIFEEITFHQSTRRKRKQQI